MRRAVDDGGWFDLAFWLAVAALAILGVHCAGWYADRCARESGGPGLPSATLGKAGREEVKNMGNHKPLLALLVCWTVGGCAAEAAGEAAAGDGGAYVRTQHEAGAGSDFDLAASADLAAAVDLPLVDLAPPPPDVGDPAPVNLYQPLPAPFAMWLESVPACPAGGIVVRGYGRGLDLGEDRCEGWTTHGVRCVECATITSSAAPLGPAVTGCRTTGSCVGGDTVALACVHDCTADCERRPRYCGGAL